MEHETAGDPITGLKWTRKTTGKIAEKLKALDINVSANTVGRILKEMGFSLRVNHKKKPSGTKNPPKPADRDRQFIYIGELRERFAREGYPVISVDTKKKEAVGNFKNNGNSWEQKPIEVNDHDFRSDAIGMAVPYGIYDTILNQGAIFVGDSYDTPAFAVDCINLWWRIHGQKYYPNARELLILADSGGSNSNRSRVWKWGIQQKLCLKHNLTVTVCHYPPGSSKWNPIEHRLFSEISKNWAGVPLESYEKVIKYARTTTTATSLKVRARLIRKEYQKGQQVSDEDMNNLSIEKHDIFPNWNYTLKLD